MKKIIIALLALFMTGCTVNYTLEIKDDKIIEDFEAIETDVEKATTKEEGGKSFEDYINKYKDVDNLYSNYYMLYSDQECEVDCKYYLIEGNVDNNEYVLILTDSHTFDEYANSTLANEYFNSFSVTFEDDKLTIKGNVPSTIFNDYPILDDINLTVKTEYEVVETNASKTGKNEYTWNVKRKDNNKTDKLYITLNTKKKSEETKQEEKEKIRITVLLIILLIILFILFISYSLFTKKKNINRL